MTSSARPVGRDRLRVARPHRDGRREDLLAKVGPGMTITVKNARGVKVSQIPRGTHKVRVRDRSIHHNFHLLGSGVNRKTTLTFVGLKIWTIRFVSGTYRYRCDPHRLHMRGRFTVA